MANLIFLRFSGANSAYAQKLLEPRIVDNNFFALVGGSKGMLSQKSLEIDRLRLSKNAFEPDLKVFKIQVKHHSFFLLLV